MSEALTVLPRESTEIELGTLRADTPAALIAGASAIATPLAKLINDRNLYSRIQGRDYVKCEGWTTMGAMLGVVPMEVSSSCDEHGVYTSIVELVNMRTGKVVGRASAECGNPDEIDKNGKPLWASRAAYARRSMAATRATGKAFRLSFSWIMAMSGYQVTPAEEMEFASYESENPAPTAEPAKTTMRSAPAGAPVWRGKVIDCDIKEGKKKDGKPYKLYKFKGGDGRIFGTFSETIASGILKLDGHFIEIVFSANSYGDEMIEEFRDVSASEVPL